jgi:drug/metabolite transporter (DMT)-like permease
MNSPLNKATRNILIFSFFWALYILQSRAAFAAGARVVPFQIEAGLSALAVFSLAMIPNGLLSEMRDLRRDAPAAFWKLALANGIHYGIGGTFYVLGISMTSAINAGFLVKFAVVTTTFLAWILLGERMSRQKLAGIFALLLGAYLLTTQGKQIVPQRGDLLILGACFAWSTGNVLVRQGLRDTSASPALASYLKPLFGLPVFVLLVALARQIPALTSDRLAFSGFDWGHAKYAILAGIFLALTWMYLNKSLKITTASYVTMLSTATPVFVAILAAVFLHERMTLPQLIGGGIILLSGSSVSFSDISTR